LETARIWLNTYNPELRACPADVFLLHGPDPIVAALKKTAA
jgi:hypothetical protein